MLNSEQRKIKQIKGRLANDDINTNEDEFFGARARQSKIQEEEKPFASKQRKSDNYVEENKLESPYKSKQERDKVVISVNEDEGDLDYEDAYDDEWEDEEFINKDKIEEESEEEEVIQVLNPDNSNDISEDNNEDRLAVQFSELKFSDEPVVYLDEDNASLKRKKKKAQEVVPFLGTTKNLTEGEVLEYENGAYDLFHRARTPWPCLSLDILIPKHKKDIINKPTKTELKNYPLSVYVVAGSQASNKTDNAVYVMKWSRLHKTRYDDDSDIIDEEDLDYDEEPRLDVLSLNHPEPINRIRSMNSTGVVALWDESGRVSIYDTSRHIQKLVEYNEGEEEIVDDEGPNRTPQGLQPPQDPTKRNFQVSSFQHSSEGYALQWSPTTLGLLATGGHDKRIYIYKPSDENGSGWSMESIPYSVHRSSVEDLEFSPDNPYLIASCSVDGTIKFVDMRGDYRNECASHIEVSEVDVNVISWCKQSPNLIAAGSDDGMIQVWDIRYLQKARPIQSIQFHEAPITSIQFQPYEDSVLTVASADNRITIWDFSVEADIRDKNDDVPEQLMFIHQGIEDAKEVTHHPYMSDLVLSTAANGFNIFKPNYEEDWNE